MTILTFKDFKILIYIINNIEKLLNLTLFHIIILSNKDLGFFFNLSSYLVKLLLKSYMIPSIDFIN